MVTEKASVKMAAVELSEAHRAEVMSYIRFAQGKRQLRLKSVRSCFQDVVEGRLTEDTYTAEEVTDLLSGLQAAVLSEVELELLNSAHTNVLLLQQLFLQSQHWHLTLHTDVSELENRQLLERVAELERGQDPAPSSAHPRLTPIEGPAQLLHAEISRLQEENDKLRGRLRTLEGRVTSALEDKNHALQELRRTAHQEEAPPPRDVSQLEDALSSLKVELQKTVGEHSATQRKMEEDLTGTKHQLLRVREQLALAERELDRKFQETAAYRNMKDILGKKNEQIKELRRKLADYEPQD
ncbi:leucine zipper transcription factor-like protein 1 [Rana temporaria]|uniref:leucine zipper transcription factor-like protein 1 n=1 Tax=Rana temporaria TaxID=8407 RepID=UPI001AAD41F6|nr:leucine zipper transcription factor-like protein 1 [Rana temporaria]